MLPILTFASGVIAGAIGVRLAKSAKTKAADLKAADLTSAAREGAGKARSGVREAAVTGLLAIERTSAGLRSRLATPVEAAPAEPVPEPVAEAPAEAVETPPVGTAKPA